MYCVKHGFVLNSQTNRKIIPTKVCRDAIDGRTHDVGTGVKQDNLVSLCADNVLEGPVKCKLAVFCEIVKY